MYTDFTWQQLARIGEGCGEQKSRVLNQEFFKISCQSKRKMEAK